MVDQPRRRQADPFAAAKPLSLTQLKGGSDRQPISSNLTCLRPRSVVLAVLSAAALLLTFAFWSGGWLLPSTRLRPDSWDGFADVGPASSPAAWQATRPLVLLLSYAAWPGVFAAARAQGPTLGLPGAFPAEKAQRLVDLIARTPSLRAVVVHGIPWGSIEFARMLRAQVPAVRILFVYHGAPSQPFHVAESTLVADLIDAENAGTVDAIGAIKAGFAETLERFGARRVFSVPNFPSVAGALPSSKYSSRDGRVHIGVFASTDALHKNAATQIVAACSVRGAVVHVTFLPAVAYLRSCDIVVAGFLPHGRFLAEVSRMDVLSYVTLTECFPMLVLEAASAGVPVVVSRTHRIFDSDPVLADALVVAEADTPSEIAVKLAGAAGNADSLHWRLLRLTSCLRREAELAWGQELGLVKEDARRLQLAAFADGSDVRSACGDFAPPAVHTALTGASNAAPAPRIRVAFLTYELAPVVPGGAGVVITNLVDELLQSGHSVTMIAYMSDAALAEWARQMEAKGWRVGAGRQLTVHHVPTLVREGALDARGCGPRNIFLRRSWLFALAAQAAYLLNPFDALEAFDYVGAGFELTRRLNEWRQASARGDASVAAPPYLPEHVPLLVRLHGTLQLIHQHEGIFVEEEVEPRTPRPCLLSDSERESWPLMYLMEQYTLRAAHLLLPQSRALQAVYAEAYNVAEDRMLLAPPPMTRIIAPLKAGGRAAPAFLAVANAGFSAGAGGDTELRLLVYGRVMRVKGAEVVAAAAQAIDAALPDGIALRLIFAGLDWDCPLHSRPTSQCVRALLPSGARSTFLGALDLHALKQLLPTVHGAVFASEFETFGMAAHELAATGLSLIVSDIPAFSEYFTQRNAYIFLAGSNASLAAAFGDFFNDLKKGTLRSANLDYAEAAAPYERISAACHQRGGLRATKADLRLLEVAIARFEEECWPTAERLSCGG